MNGRHRYHVIQNDPEVFMKLPKSLLNDLQKSARENGRSLNTELIIRLGRTFSNTDVNDIENDILNMLFDSK